MKHVARALLIVAVTAGICGVCEGVVKEFDLPHMVKESDLIVVARVIKILERPIEEPFHSGWATLEIEQVIEGAHSGRKIRLDYAPRLSTDLTFAVGERCIFFIRSFKQRNSVVQGYAGKVEIENESVRVNFIRGEERKQTLHDLISKIKTIAGSLKKMEAP